MEEKNRGEVNLANKKKSTWIVDSGCTQHMCNDKSLFTTLGDLKEPKNMLMGNGDVLEVTQEGNVGLRVPTNQGVVHGTFREVLYTPEIRRNLVSVTKLMRQKISTVFHEETNKCYLVRGKVWFDPRDVVGYAHPNNDLWVMDEKGSSGESGESYSAEQSAEEKLWHLRLGHLGNDNLKKMLSKEMVRGFKPMVRFEGTHPVCEGCMKGRQSREAFPDAEHRGRDLLELVHSDVCGPITPKSNGGNRYYLTFVDDFSRKSWVYLMREKKEVFRYFKLGRQ
jgi:hypothetical protein